jgi:hypothetical protein
LPACHGHAVEVGHHDVEHEGVGVEVAGDGEGVEARAGRAHLPTFHAQGHRQQVGEHLLVVDDEHAKRRSVGAVECGRGGGSGHGSIVMRRL